jgi:hypothetical protein
LLDAQNLGGVHGELPQTQTKQQAGEAGVARHFTAQTDVFTRRSSLRNSIGQQLQNSWMQGIVQMRDLLICSVNCQFM